MNNEVDAAALAELLSSAYDRAMAAAFFAPDPPNHPVAGARATPAPDSAEATWQTQLARSLERPEQLAAQGLWPKEAEEAMAGPAGQFRFRIPQAYAARFDQNNLAACPLYRQAVPTVLESDPELPHWAQAMSLRALGRELPWEADAIGDVARLGAPRLTHRYGNRAILHTTHACALYCRFCFRKTHLASKEPALYGGSFAPAMAYLAEHTEVTEVILTGGDPLALPDAQLARVVGQLCALPHMRVVRLHSRMPGVLPARLTTALADQLAAAAGQCQVVLVAHINHAKELTSASRTGLAALRRRGITVLNQAVLMRGINDTVTAQRELCSQLYEAGSLPYYLHHPDWVPHTFGFRPSIAAGRELMRQLVGELSGPAVPTYVLDLPGGLGKVRLMDPAVQPLDEAGASHQDEQLQGTLWQMPQPHTRAKAQGTLALYPDLSLRSAI